jgi:hypothetical protein
MKKLFIVFIMLIVCCFSALAAVTRTFSASGVAPGGTITLTYTPSGWGTGTSHFWAVEQPIPTGWLVDGNSMVTLSIFQTDQTAKTYTLKAPDDATTGTSFSFAGQYAVDTDTSSLFTSTTITIS